MVKKVSVLLFLFLTLFASSWAQEYQVFVNNKPFKGQSDGKPAAIMLEAEALKELVKFDLVVDREAGTATLDGEPVSTRTVGDVVLVDAKELANRSGGRYLVNSDLKTVDVYLMLKPARSGADGPGPNTFLVISRDGGMRWKFSEDSAEFKPRYSYGSRESGVSFRVTGPDGKYFTLDFCAPSKGILKPGEYNDAARFPFQGPMQPGMDVSGNGWGNNTLWGQFTVHEIRFGPDGPTSFSVDFVQRDNNKKGTAMRGSLRYHAWHE